MTVLATDAVETYAYSGPASVPYSFKVYETDEIRVVFIDGTTGARTIKSLSYEYTVSRNADFQGGSVLCTFSGVGFVELRLNLPYEQDIALADSGPLILQTFERMVDKVVCRIQMLNWMVENEISLPAYSGNWQTATAYDVGDLVLAPDSMYHCKISHTSGTFATDLAAGKWELILSESSLATALSLPAIVAGSAGKAIRVNAGETGYELSHVVPRAQVSDAGSYPIINIGETDYENVDPSPAPRPRCKFEYASASSIKIYGFGQYWLYGKGDVIITSSGGITKTLTPSGTSYWHYVYIDYSAITTRWLTVATEFIDSTTAPTYSATKRGWYNGDDRAIFAVWIDGSGNVTPFWHKTGEDRVWHDDRVTVRAYAALAASWANTVSFAAGAPAFTTEVLVSSYSSDATNNAIVYFRPTGSTAATGIRIHRTDASLSRWDTSIYRASLGTSQSLDYRSDQGTSTSLQVDVAAWFFPALV